MRKWAALVAVAAFIVCTAQLAPPSSSGGGGVPGAAGLGLSVPTKSLLGFTTQYGSWSSTYSQTGLSGVGVNFVDTTKESQAEIEGSLMAYPSVPFTATAVFSTTPQGDISICFGPAASASGSSEVLVQHVNATTPPGTIDIEDWTNPTTFSATVDSPLNWFGGPYIWFRYQDDGTKSIYSISMDGVNWEQVYSVAKSSDFLATNGGYHFFGAIIAPYNDAGGTVMLGYKLTKP